METSFTRFLFLENDQIMVNRSCTFASVFEGENLYWVGRSKLICLMFHFSPGSWCLGWKKEKEKRTGVVWIFNVADFQGFFFNCSPTVWHGKY